MYTKKRLVLNQSNYIPWKGYFDLIAASDEFVIFDEVQFTKNDWRNRNRVVLNGKLHWLTIAIKTAGVAKQSIQLAEVSDRGWARIHWEILRQAYRKAPYFGELGPVLEETYRQAATTGSLTEINQLFLEAICCLLGITTSIVRSDVVKKTAMTPTQRIIEICKARGATEYLSGPAARAYLEEEQLRDAGIALEYADYSGYSEYQQHMPVFEHGVSIIDALFRCGGTGARAMLKSVRAPDSFHIAASPKSAR